MPPSFSPPAYGVLLIALFCFSFFAGKFIRHFALRYGIYEIASTGERIALWGGLAFMLPLAAYASIFLGLSAGKAFIFFLAILAFALFGLLDDLLSFSPLPQILMQAVVSLALLFVFFPMQASGMLPTALVLFLFFIASMNAMNWINGLDGLAEITFLAALLPIAGLFFFQGDFMSGWLVAAFFATLLGFFLLNIFPATLYMGTSGSIGLGLFAGIIVAAHPNFLGVLLCALALPLGDAGVVSIQRIFAGVLPWRGGDRRHLYYQLFDRGVSLQKILFLYATVTIFSSLFGIVATVYHSSFSVFLLPLVVVTIFPFVLEIIPRSSKTQEFFVKK